MKKFFALILICTLCLALCACGQQAQAPETDGGVNIVATVFPAYDFARQIAGDDGNVTLLIPPGSEAHSYEPTPQDIIRIQNCDLLVCNGGESEAWLDEILDGMGKEIPPPRSARPILLTHPIIRRAALITARSFRSWTRISAA